MFLKPLGFGGTVGQFHFIRAFASLRDKTPKIDPRSLYEPMIVDTRPFPEYKTFNVRLQAYDYALLETFQSYVDLIARRFGFKILDSYAVAAKTEKVVTFKRNSTLVNSSLELALYDRWIRIANAPAIRLPIFINLLRAHTPVGLSISVQEHTKEDENYRYVPNAELKTRQEELRSLDNPLVRKALGWE